VKKLIQMLKHASGVRSETDPASTNQRSGEPPQRQAPTGPRPAPTPAAKPVSNVTFSQLGLAEPILKAVLAEGYTHPTPIQEKAIPHVIQGKDLLGCAQTGTGKTAAFALPILHRLNAEQPTGRGIRALILTPTRELALQINESFATYGKNLRLRTAVVFGGVGLEPQKQALRRGVDILVATPGRLLDLQGQGLVDVKSLSIFVLDEADRMLDMGFIHDVKRVINFLPRQRQNLMFSATMPRDIQDLAYSVLKDPVKVEVAPVSSTSEMIDQSIYFVDRTKKPDLLLHVIEQEQMKRALIFTRTKARANRVAEFLTKNGINAEAIHGNKSQSARQRALDNFKKGTTRILVASDLASRGIDIEEISHVINFDLPNVPETYVHRIGRTGRAQATGLALSFCDHEEKEFLHGIERLTRQKVPVIDHPFPMSAIAPPPSGDHNRGGRGRGGGGGRGRHGGGGGGGGGGRGRHGGGGGGGGGGGRGGGGRGRRSGPSA
jgi:ATP-dependent RNA helicase RhlE